MASKKIKKALMAGLAGYVGSKIMAGKARADSIASNEAKEAGFANTKKNYITKKAKSSGFKERVKKAVDIYKKKGLNTGPGINATSKKGGTLAGDYGDAFGDGFSGGAKTGKIVKARGGKLVSLKPTKLY